MSTKRQQLLNLIRVEVAQEGKITATAIRIHVENRCISRSAMMEAAREGMAIYERRRSASMSIVNVCATWNKIMDDCKER